MKNCKYILITGISITIICLYPLLTSEGVAFSLRSQRFSNILIAGGCLGFCGLGVQLVSRNNLLDSYSSGVAPAALLGFVLGSIYKLESSFPLDYILSLTLSLLSSLLLLITSRASKTSLFIGGILLGGLCLTLTNILIYLNPSNTRILSVYNQLFSNFESFNLNTGIVCIIITLLFALVFDFFFRHSLLGLSMDDEKLSSLGLNRKYFSFTLLLISSILTCIITIEYGIVSFIGLLVPNLIRSLWGVNFKGIFLTSILIGSLSLAAIDSVGRIFAPPYGVPAGLLTPLLGIPLLLLLMIKSSSARHE